MATDQLLLTGSCRMKQKAMSAGLQGLGRAAHYSWHSNEISIVTMRAKPPKDKRVEEQRSQV